MTTDTPTPPSATDDVAAFRARAAALAEAARARLAAGWQPTRPGDLLLRPPTAAAFLGVSEKMLWYWRRHGGGPIYYRGGRSHVGYRLADLAEFRERWRVEPKSAPTGPNQG